MLRTDNGGEFYRNAFEEFYKRSGIERKKTNPCIAQNNGGVKRMNMTLMEKEINMLRNVEIR